MGATGAKRRVYITGITGKIGRVLGRELGQEYDIAGNSRSGTPVDGATVAKGDVLDRSFIRSQLSGVDTVIHLAADPSPRATWESISANNINGAYEVFEAARLGGVRRIIFASSNHVTGILTEQAVDMDTTVPIRPDSYYGLSKAFGEALGRYYHDRYGLSVLNFRIGWIPGELSEEALIERFKDRGDAYPLMWLSPGDCVRAHRAGIEAPDSLGYGTYYIMSRNRDMLWDMQNAREELGYDPQDDLGEIFDRHGVPYNFRIPREGLGG